MGIDSSYKLVGCLSGTRTCAMSESKLVSSISGLILFLSHSFQETPKVYQFTRTPFLS